MLFYLNTSTGGRSSAVFTPPITRKNTWLCAILLAYWNQYEPVQWLCQLEPPSEVASPSQIHPLGAETCSFTEMASLLKVAINILLSSCENGTHREPVNLWLGISILVWVNLYLKTKRLEKAWETLLYVTVINLCTLRYKSIFQYSLGYKTNLFKLLLYKVHHVKPSG